MQFAEIMTTQASVLRTQLKGTGRWHGIEIQAVYPIVWKPCLPRAAQKALSVSNVPLSALKGGGVDLAASNIPGGGVLLYKCADVGCFLVQFLRWERYMGLHREHHCNTYIDSSQHFTGPAAAKPYYEVPAASGPPAAATAVVSF